MSNAVDRALVNLNSAISFCETYGSEGDMAVCGETLYDAVINAKDELEAPDHVVLPRAEVEALRRDHNTLGICTDAFARLHLSQSALRVEYEALRARCERLRRLTVDMDQLRQRWAPHLDFGLEPGDLTDDLRSLDELPPLKLAPLPEGKE